MITFKTHDDDERRTEWLEQRLSPSAKNLIEQAAALQGVTASEFARSHTIQTAHETIRLMEATRLAPEDRDAFIRAFDDDRLNEALIDISELHAQSTEHA